MIELVNIYRCTGKVDGRNTYKINVIAGTHNHARRTAEKWVAQHHPEQKGSVDWNPMRVNIPELYLDWPS